MTDNNKDAEVDSPSNLIPSPNRPWSEIWPFAIISLISFIIGVSLLLLMLFQADKLVALGLDGKYFYVTLIPLGLAVGAFLFGVLRSHARYRGKVYGGTLELGGPIVGLVLVVIGGFVLVPDPNPFPLTVFVHGEAGPSDVVIRNSGYVVLDTVPNRRREAISDKGQAHFPGIPTTFRGQEVLVWIEADGFEAVNPNQKQSLDGDVLYLPVRKKAGRVFGRVQDEHGNPIVEASVDIDGLRTETDETGRFDVSIPGDRMRPELSLYVSAPGFIPWRNSIVPNANEVTIQLRHKI